MTEKPVAIVTGVEPGAGSAIVRRFASGGFRVVALARSADRIDALAQEFPDVHPLTCNVSDEEQVRIMVAETRRRFGPTEVLIHNAVGGGWETFARSIRRCSNTIFRSM
jgi:NAD(P)-dependent dehydrogenase (short-subunit alcohol dehydrogenase family)